ncbi:bifunctional riboflavin kinase/FAD synthetase [Leptobacterium sp. I13]|uniref:bifunctional riboflavin kinase/FAD synthetase n=1 Tax=Leptobacterium meishanense TaxID=3128904 RepID=UPI0030EB99C1
MVTYKNIKEFNNPVHTAITIGTFDGVHLGHQKIIKRLIATSRANELNATILTFFPHPRMVLQQNEELKLITTLEEKIALLKKMGLDQLIIHPFTKDFSRLSAHEFVTELLVNQLHVKKMIVGYDHRFGRNRTATIKDLVEYGDSYHFEVEEISAEEINEVSISSTKIRKALHEGDIATANLYLGYPFMLTGIITQGKGLGKQLTFPTANLYIEETYKLIPKNGAYIVKSLLKEREVYGMMNIGYNPTVNGTKKTIEVHFFDFDEDLYGQKIQVHLLERLRNEQKFDSVAVLKEQLKKDKENALAYIKNSNA